MLTLQGFTAGTTQPPCTVHTHVLSILLALAFATLIAPARHERQFGHRILMVDAPPFRIVAPNLTSGKGSATASFTDADWVRSLRPGVLAPLLGTLATHEPLVPMTL